MLFHCVEIRTCFIHSPLHFQGNHNFSGQMAPQVFLISQICLIAIIAQVYASFQYLVLILGFWLLLESVIGICQHEDQSSASGSQGSHY